MHALKEFIHKVLCEADEQKTQDIRAVFKDWIRRFETEYIQVEKDKGYTVTSFTLKESKNYIYIVEDFSEWHRDDWFIIAQRKSDGHIFIVDTLASTFAFAFAHIDYYKEQGWLFELASVEHFNVAIMASDNLGEFNALCKAMGVK